jgi:hypothetical protein
MNMDASAMFPVPIQPRIMCGLLVSCRIVASENYSNFYSAATMLPSDSAPAAFDADCERPMANLTMVESYE